MTAPTRKKTRKHILLCNRAVVCFLFYVSGGTSLPVCRCYRHPFGIDKKWAMLYNHDRSFPHVGFPFYKTLMLCRQKGLIMNDYSPQDFDIRDTVLVKYNGKAAHVIVPAGVTVIDSCAFEKNRILRIVELPDTVTTIRSFAFDRCRALKRIVIPQSALKLSKVMIWECGQVSIQAPTGSAAAKYAADQNNPFIPMDSNTSAPIFEDFIIQGTTLVKYNGKAAHVIVPAGVTVIDSYAFESKRSLRIVELPDTVTTIRSFAFVRCRALERVVIPQNVLELDSVVINHECDQVSIYAPAGSAAAQYAAYWKMPFIPTDSNTSTPIFEDFIIQGTTLVKYYGDEAHVTVPAGVTAINGKAFYRRQKLKTVELPDTVTTIREDAFYDCRKLERIIIPQSVTELDSWMISECDQVSIQAPAGSPAAKYATRQRIPFIPMDSTTSTPDSADFIIQGTTLVKYYGNEAHVTVPAGVTVINHEAFYRRPKLKTVELPDTVTTIKRWAFRECRALERIVIPQSVTKLSSDLIEECDRVTIQAPAGSAAAICATKIPLRQRGPRPADWMPPQSHPLLCYRQGGNVHQLRGNILITVYLVTDKKTAWTAAAEADYRSAHNEAIRDMEQEALRRKIPLRIHTIYKQIQVDYTCTVSESDWDWSDKMEAICLPDSAPGYDERPVILVVNKKLRSHAYPREKVNGIPMSTAREYCVIGHNFRYFSGRTIRHELFHLFGAPDLYTPQSVKGPASRLLPGSIMNDGNITDALTAYCIGWTDTLSPEALIVLWETRNLKI